MLVSLNDYKKFLEIDLTNSNQDGDLQILALEVEDFIKSYLNRDLEEAEYTEDYDGDGTSRLILNQFPVTACASIEVYETDWTALDYTRLVIVAQSTIYIEGNKFPKGNQNVRVVYTAGYTDATLPKEVRMRAKELMLLYYNEWTGNRTLGVSNVNKSGAGINDITTIDKEETLRILTHLDKYRAIPI